MPARYSSASTFAATGDVRAAIVKLRNAVTPDGIFAPAKFNLGKAPVSDGLNDEGAKFIAEAIALDPSLKPKA